MLNTSVFDRSKTLTTALNFNPPWFFFPCDFLYTNSSQPLYSGTLMYHDRSSDWTLLGSRLKFRQQEEMYRVSGIVNVAFQCLY